MPEASVLRQALGRFQFPGSRLESSYSDITVCTGILQFRGSCFASSYSGITIRGSVLHQAIGRLPFLHFCFCIKLLGTSNCPGF